MDGLRPLRRALLSVSDKAGLEPLARRLAAGGVALVSTGATARLLRGAGLEVVEVAAITGVPEMLGGRVKTLHPRIHGGLLARRDDPAQMAEAAAAGIAPFDLLVVNLYPFEAARARGVAGAALVEEIDVGGPAMIRAGAKNHDWVCVLSDPADYEEFLAEWEGRGGTSAAFRRARAAAAFARTAAYDAAVAEWMAAGDLAPERLLLAGRRAAALRYGENPHQRAALYLTGEARPGVATARQAQGKELSFNNIADADAALECAAEFTPAEGAACVVVKHMTPCGAALGATPAEAWARALAGDPVSAFGGIVAFNRALDIAAAEALAGHFLEVVVAPGAEEAALAHLARKGQLRLLLTEEMPDPRARGRIWRQVAGGMLVQDRDAGVLDPAALGLATQRAPTAAEMRDLLFAWRVAKHARSNAVVLAEGLTTLGVGSGLTSRVDAVRLAAGKLGARAPGAAGRPVMASDGFLPFADGIEAAAAAGVTAVIQPGGSQRDAEVAAAADRHGMAMVLTGLRHFRH
jgi:phosphoribosylaminoimidazolecarboxamide formyltransferase/IMP cyclohydrolase